MLPCVVPGLMEWRYLIADAVPCAILALISNDRDRFLFPADYNM